MPNAIPISAPPGLALSPCVTMVAKTRSMQRRTPAASRSWLTAPASVPANARVE